MSDSIPKSKIKDKIAELQNQMREYDKKWNRNKQHPFYRYLIRIGAEIDILEEILEEN